MKLTDIFDVFTRRNREPELLKFVFPQPTRNRIIMHAIEMVDYGFRFTSRDAASSYWRDVHRALCYHHGTFSLTNTPTPLSPREQVLMFASQCSDEEFIDVLEYLFKSNELISHSDDVNNTWISEIIDILTSDNIGYEITNMVTKTEIVSDSQGAYNFGGQRRRTMVISYPKVIQKDSQLEHSQMTKPVLALLSDSKYRSANQEYREALEHYRKKEYGDCLTKCNSSLESVIKILCHGKGLSYKQSNDAAKLVKTVINHGGLPPYLQKSLLTPSLIRNDLSKSHGAGTSRKKAKKSIARYALNATASAIIYLHDELG